MTQIQSWATIVLLAIGAWQGAKAAVILTRGKATTSRNSPQKQSE